MKLYTMQRTIFVLLAVICGHSKAIDCFSRGGDASVSNGSAVSCNAPGYDYCYAYSVDTVNFAGCSSSDICSAGTFADCAMCRTSFCNRMTPSRISCFSRSGSTGSNGTQTTCHAGVTTCFTYGTAYSNTAGCGRCDASDPTCITCGTDYCNSWTPSRLSCFYSPSASSNGLARSCATGHSTCYSYQSFAASSASHFGGCGSCNVTANPSCITCSTDLCNRRFPSAIGCYQRYEYITSGGSISNGMPVSCSAGITTCYSFTVILRAFYLIYNVAGCGTCDPEVVPSCSVCSTGFCNTATPTSVSCYHQSSLTNTNQQAVPCYGGIKSCFSLTKEMGNLSPSISIGIKGCGVCTARTASAFGCTCNATNCYVSAGTTQLATTKVPITSPRSTHSVTYRTAPRTTADSATTSAPRAAPRTTADSATTSAHRTAPRTTADSATTSAPRTAPRTTKQTSSPGSSEQPTTTNPGIRCYYSVAEVQLSSRKKVLCPLSSSCYKYSFGYGGTNFYFAGCGDCPFHLRGGNQQVIVEDSNCRSCNTDYCNSAGSPVQLAVAVLLASLATAAARLQIWRL